jgi:hypothetical protein
VAALAPYGSSRLLTPSSAACVPPGKQGRRPSRGSAGFKRASHRGAGRPQPDGVVLFVRWGPYSRGWRRSLRLYGLGFLHYSPFLWIRSTIAREYCTDACFWCFVARRLVPCCYRTPFSHLSKTPVLQLMSRVRVLRVVRGMEFKKLFELNSDPLKDADTTVIRLYKGQPSVVWNVPL